MAGYTSATSFLSGHPCQSWWWLRRGKAGGKILRLCRSIWSERSQWQSWPQIPLNSLWLSLPALIALWKDRTVVLSISWQTFQIGAIKCFPSEEASTLMDEECLAILLAHLILAQLSNKQLRSTFIKHVLCGGECCFAKICAYCGVCYFKEGKLGFHYIYSCKDNCVCLSYSNCHGLWCRWIKPNPIIYFGKKPVGIHL